MHLTLTTELTGFDQAWSSAVAQGAAELGAQLRSAVADQFLTEGRAYGTPWLPRKARQRHLSNRPLLFRSGRLLGSLLDADDPEHIEEIEGDTFHFGSAVPYAAAHQWGTRNLPARPILTPEMLRG